MAYFAGTWTCHQMMRGKDRPDTSTSMMDLNDRWIKTTDVAPAFDSYRTSPVNTTTYTTYDASVKRYVQVSVDDFGGYGIAYSTGWNGNTMRWTDNSASNGAVGMTTISKVSDSEYNWKFEGTMGNGKPQDPQTRSRFGLRNQSFEMGHQKIDGFARWPFVPLASQNPRDDILRLARSEKALFLYDFLSGFVHL